MGDQGDWTEGRAGHRGARDDRAWGDRAWDDTPRDADALEDQKWVGGDRDTAALAAIDLIAGGDTPVLAMNGEAAGDDGDASRPDDPPRSAEDDLLVQAAALLFADDAIAPAASATRVPLGEWDSLLAAGEKTNRSGRARRPTSEWEDLAACLSADANLFYPREDGTPEPARRICRLCLVRTECLDYALAARERFGVWGGFHEGERRAIRRYERATGHVHPLRIQTRLQVLQLRQAIADADADAESDAVADADGTAGWTVVQAREADSPTASERAEGSGDAAAA